MKYNNVYTCYKCYNTHLQINTKLMFTRMNDIYKLLTSHFYASSFENCFLNSNNDERKNIEGRKTIRLSYMFLFLFCQYVSI